MNPIGFETLLTLTILLPGFLSAAILNGLTVRRERTQLEKIVEALVFSFVLYALWTSLVLQQPLTIHSEKVEDKVTRYSISLEPADVLWLFGLAVGFGLLMSLLVTNDIPTKLLRWLRITHVSTRSSVWGDVFIDIKKYVLVEFADGRRILGWPRYVSDTPDEASIFLEKASWVLDDGSEVPIHGPGILITKHMPIQSVSFLEPKLSDQEQESNGKKEEANAKGIKP